MYMLKNKDIKEYELDKQNIWDMDEVSNEYGAYAVIELLEECLKSYNNYLVFAFNCRWNGASGYKFTDDLLETVVRDYDVTQYLQNISKGNKSIIIKEFHHDAPTGHYTVIVGLTDKEYEKLENANFLDVENFARKYLKN